MAGTIHSFYALVFKIWRAKRHTLFLRKMNPDPRKPILDVGGYPWFWTSHDACCSHVDTVNLHAVAWDNAKHPDRSFGLIIGNGCALPFKDATYPLAFSNSVIEHVGTWEDQKNFAREIRRVGRSIWVQTPAFECPLEPHFIAPFVHYLPRRLRRFAIRWLTPRGLLDAPGGAEMDELERYASLPKRKCTFFSPTVKSTRSGYAGFFRKPTSRSGCAKLTI